MHEYPESSSVAGYAPSPFYVKMGQEKYRPLETFYRITMPKFLKTGQ